MEVDAQEPEGGLVVTAHPIVEAKGLTKFYGAEPLRRKALHAVDLMVNRGEFVTVRGPSGCGKSTLLGIVGGLDRQFDGKLWLFGDDVELLSDAELAHRRARRLGFVFQAFHLLGHLNARENVLTASLFSEEHASASARRRLTERADDLLEQLGLAGRGDDMPATSPGGSVSALRLRARCCLSPSCCSVTSPPAISMP